MVRQVGQMGVPELWGEGVENKRTLGDCKLCTEKLRLLDDRPRSLLLLVGRIVVLPEDPLDQPAHVRSGRFPCAPIDRGVAVDGVRDVPGDLFSKEKRMELVDRVKCNT